MMVGGGPHKVTSGQVTDDTEMAMSNALGLLDSNVPQNKKLSYDKFEINADFIAFRYRDWFRSDPFDIGITIKNSIKSLNIKTRNLTENLELINVETRAKLVKKAAIRQNSHSKSNGCMMRLSFINVWSAGLASSLEEKDFEQLKKAIKCDVEFTHPEKLSQHACVLFSAAISILLNHPTEKDKGQFAFNKCMELAQSQIANF